MTRYFRGSFLLTAAGLLLAAALGWRTTGTASGTMTVTFIVAVLAVLEVSLSFDNAVVNAAVLREMDAVWRQRFITWGIPIAVFGMRIVFPLLIVAVTADISPWSALVLAGTEPDGYSRAHRPARTSRSPAFGGTFLAMVGLKHFLDHEKEVHWIPAIEEPLALLGRIEAVGLALVLLMLWIVVSGCRCTRSATSSWSRASLGLVTFIAVDGIAALLDARRRARRRGGAFRRCRVPLPAGARRELQLRRRDRSVRALQQPLRHRHRPRHRRDVRAQPDPLLVERGTLTEYRYLEHGAFWAILSSRRSCSWRPCATSRKASPA